MRNPNGYGTVKKLSGKRRKPFAALTPAHYVPGELKMKREIIGYFEKRSDAMAALGAWHQNPDSVLKPVAANEMNLLQLKNEFFESQRFKNISRQTQDNYRAAWKHLAPLCEYKVKDLRTAFYQSIIDQCAEKGMSQSSLQKIKILAGLLCDYAVQNDIVSKNYASFIVLPKAEHKEKTPFSDLDLAKIERAAEDGIMYADLILILCYTGWRINEFLSLTKFNYDEKNKTLTGGLKTEAGKNRVVPVSPKIEPYLQKWIKKGGETIVCREEGDKLVKVTAAYFRQNWYYPTLEKLGLPKLTPHATRHTFASMLHKKGADNWDIQRLMGHSSLEVTNKVYTHVDIEQLKDAVGLL